MIFIYTNHDTRNPFPVGGEMFRCETETWQQADALFLAKFGFAHFSVKQLAFVTMYSPDWPCCGGK